MDFYLFTKSRWDEAPRLRHQVAHLLASRGHEVLFFEKPSFARGSERKTNGQIAVCRTRALLHPQLRAKRWMSAINNALERRQIRRIAPSSPRIGIINFNYDYEFLRDLYPESTIVTIINDDFIDGARWFSQDEATRVLGATAGMSDQNLGVSYPLVEQLRRFSPKVDLFLPWARSAYAAPPLGLDRPDLLYWGYINDRIDAMAVRGVLDTGLRIHFVGPITPSPKISLFLRHPNATHYPGASLGDIRQIVDRCCASILPYDDSYKQISAITINNRAFEILSFGLPLLYSDLPGLIDAPAVVIYKCDTPESYVAAARAAAQSFDHNQGAIIRFLRGHSGSERYLQLMGYFAQCEIAEAEIRT